MPASRVLVAGACALLAAAATGCATTAASSTVTATGRTLTIYAGQPPGDGGQAAQDVLDAERLALSQAGGKAGSFEVRLVTLNAPKVSDNARRTIEDAGAIAYLGEIAPGSSADSIGITNSQDLLQVSPTDTSVSLTQATAAVPNSPTRYYESLKTYGRTFARVVPTDALEAKALVAEIGGRGVKRLYVAGDGSDYAAALAAAVGHDAGSAGLTVQHSPAGADGILYAGRSGSSAAQLFNGAGPSVKLFASSAVTFDSAFASALSPAAAGQVEVSSPGFAPGNLPANAAQQFVTPFRSAYGHAPSTEAIFGYEAMAAVLSVLRETGSGANNRSKVVHGFFAIKNRPSVLGTYSIDVAGDTSLAPFVFSHVKSGQLAPFKAVQEG
jgi:branched-chain amino acid transport system substrate-binding protein